MSRFYFALAVMVAALLGILAVMLTLAPYAHAQMMCGQRASIIASLDQKYQERPEAFGISGEATLVELFTSEKGSWTIIVTRPGGVACILAVGQSWEKFPQTMEKQGT